MSLNFTLVAENIKQLGKSLGFQDVAICDTDLTRYYQRYLAWLNKNWTGDMSYLHRHLEQRAKPEVLLPGTIRIISVRLDYLPINTQAAETLSNPKLGYISRYALGRDYHKLMRKRIHKLAEKITEIVGPFGYRAFTDSAPVLEKPIAEKAGIGWIGKNTLIINKKAGSWFFLGELYTDLPLPVDETVSNHCGSCVACLEVCPTQAIVAPYQLEATRCISYLTIEHKGTIPLELRRAMGNRIFGCDDCQLVCPWNKFAKFTKETDFHPRHHLDHTQLIELFAWTEAEFLKKTEGSAIRRTGYIGWLRNIAVALGNAPTSPEIIAALETRKNHAEKLIQEHVNWALEQHKNLLYHSV
jgi:epoxyqueuosine reductase